MGSIDTDHESTTATTHTDEVSNYVDARYISATDAIYRI